MFVVCLINMSYVESFSLENLMCCCLFSLDSFHMHKVTEIQNCQQPLRPRITCVLLAAY